MQIALTKKLAAAMGVKPDTKDESVNPLFCWTANWTYAVDGRKDDMVVMVNNATTFTVAIYGIKSNRFKNIEQKMIAAIKNTLLALNFNPTLVDEYIRLAGDVSFTSNHDRQMTARVNHKGLVAAFNVRRAMDESPEGIKYEDTLGSKVSLYPVDGGKAHGKGFIPAQKMISALSELTGQSAYKYRAFELLVTLDLEEYKATRRLIVPADIEFQDLHTVLQNVFDWEDYHLFDFTVLHERTKQQSARLVPDEEILAYDDTAVLMNGHTLSEYITAESSIIYTYDMGDFWEHEIKLVRDIEEHNEASPYLLEAMGQTPPEDVGGVQGYLEFRKIMSDPGHPEYAATKEWAGLWLPELQDWKTRPRVIN